MNRPDLNLLIALDILLEEQNVAAAARRMQLSPSAMSRTLARLREATCDPLLVRAGRGLAPTPRAVEIHSDVRRVLNEALALLHPVEAVDPATIDRIFTIRTSEGFVETFGPRLIERVIKEAPQARLRFVQKTDRDPSALRDGLVDLETGVVGRETGPEIRTTMLFRDRFIGVVRRDHPLAAGDVSLEQYIAGMHVEIAQHVTRHGLNRLGPIDDSLQQAGAQRNVVAIVGGFSTALALARSTQMIATVPEHHTANLRIDMHTFDLPFEISTINVSLMWHPKTDSDQAHRWIRGCLRDTCRDALSLTASCSDAADDPHRFTEHEHSTNDDDEGVRP